MKESKRTHWFYVTLSFAPKRSSNKRALRSETQSNRESMRPLWFFYLYILSSATTALSTLCQDRLYPPTHTHTHIYIYIYWDREKTERLYFHPYKLVSWLLTHQGIFIKTGFIYASLVSTVYWLAVSRPPNYFCTWYIFNSMRTQLTRFNRIGQSLTWVVNYTIKGIPGKLRKKVK